MLAPGEVAQALKHVRLIPVEGPFHRYAALSFVHQQLVAGRQTGILRGLGAKMNGGRFTPRDSFETLYVATTAETARIEAESRFSAEGSIRAPARPYVHFLITGRLQSVIDLTSDSALKELGTTVEEMCAPWVVKQMRGKEAETQLLGRLVHAALRIEGILFRSTKDQPDGRCLAILPDRLKRGSVLNIADETGLIQEILP